MGKKNQKGPNRSSSDKKEKNWLHKYSRFVNLFIIVAGVSYAYVLIHEKWSEITALSMVSRKNVEKLRKFSRKISKTSLIPLAETSQ